MVKTDLNPYNSQLVTQDSQLTAFRYLYTGREWNLETASYYYRARIMDAGIGRFTSKDPILYLNLYRYVKNNPLRYLDRFGRDPDDGDNWEDVDYYVENWGAAPPTNNIMTGSLGTGAPDETYQSCDEINESTGQSFSECMNNCLSETFSSKDFTLKYAMPNPAYSQRAVQENVTGITILTSIKCGIDCLFNSNSHTILFTTNLGNSNKLQIDKGGE